MWAGILIVAIPLLASENAAIEGIAFNRLTQVAVPGVTIKLALVSAPNEQIYTVTSDPAGEFRIENAKDGDYVASFDPPPGYQAPERWDPSYRPFHFAAGGNPTKLRIPLVPLGKLSGRVLDGDGHPVLHVRVEIYGVHHHGGPITTTDAEGWFSSGYLQPGSYQLRARPVLAGTPLGQRLGILSPLPATPPEGKRWSWVPTYFPNSVDIEGAETILVREGADLTGYEIRLRSAPVYRLRGVVADTGGTPIGRVELLLASQTGYGIAEAQVQSGRDGSFEFLSVPSGKWHISADVTRDKTDWKGSAELMMPNHDIEDVSVRISPPFALDGIVEGLPQRRVVERVVLYLVPTDGEQTNTAAEQPNGSLHIESLYPGRYRIGQLTVIPGYYLESILLGNENATGRDVFIGANSPPFRLLFKSNAARVRGSVEDGAGVKVVLVEADQEHYRPGSIRVVVCDSDGRFNIEGLRPASYYAFASRAFNGSEGAATEAIFAGELGGQAESVHLSEGETATLHLKVTQWPE